jgi:hypothetical protein
VHMGVCVYMYVCVCVCVCVLVCVIYDDKCLCGAGCEEAPRERSQLGHWSSTGSIVQSLSATLIGQMDTEDHWMMMMHRGGDLV